MKYIAATILIVLFGALATLLPLRPGFRQIARRLMQERRDALKTDTTLQANVVQLRAADIPENAWEGADELRQGNRLYDVVSVTTKNGVRYFNCLADDAEVAAEATADKLVQGIVMPDPFTPQGKFAQSLSDWLSHLFYESPADTQLFAAGVITSIYAGTPVHPLPDAFAAPDIQPPDVLG